MSIGQAREITRDSNSDRHERRSPEALREQASALLREVIADADAEGVVVALSGGVDSATTAALAVDTFGADAVTALLMPTETNADANTADARELAESLGVDNETVPLDPAMDVFKRHIAPRIASEGDDRAAGNLAARLRMACAYFVANAENRIVVGTSNRTERLLGYFTKYGDGAADVFPLGEYDKGEVRALATHLGVPADIVEKPPTAGFRKGQTDEADLGASYETLDRVLHAIVAGSSPGTAGSIDDFDAFGSDSETAERQARRVVSNAHKRSRPATPSRSLTEVGAGAMLDIDVAETRSCVDSVRQFVREYVESTAADGVVVNLSGGLDSSVTAAIAADALGPAAVHGLFFPCHLASEYDTPDPGHLATSLDIDYDRVNIRPLVTELEAQLPTQLTRAAGTRELGNFVARVRMACAYYVANTTDRLVLGATNRTEDLLGYFTKYGDGAADLRPLGSLYRTEVRALGRHLDLPDPVLEQPSTAGFRIGTTDEDELGASYGTIDEVLVRLVDRDMGIERTARELGVDPEIVRRYATAHAESRHKRTVPPSTETGLPDPEHFHELELKFS